MRIFSIKNCKRIASLSFRPDGRELAVIITQVEDHVGSILWLDIHSGEPARAIELDAERCAIAPHHDKLAVSYSPYTLRTGVSAVRWTNLIGKGEGSWNNVPDLPHHQIFALSFTPDGKRLAIGCSGQQSHNHPWNHAIHIAPLGRGKALTLAVEEMAGEVTFSPDGRWMVVTGGPGGDPRIRFHAYPLEMWQADYMPKATRTRRLVFAPDRPELVALAGKQAILLLAGRSEPLAFLDGHASTVTDAAYSPDGHRVVTVGNDATGRVWDARAGAQLRMFAWPVGKLSAVAFSPDGLTCAAGGEKGKVVVWDVDE